ncbi:class I SAM-dependent methyltransferase [bacterium]|nr:MAG: class I SAM-dependent methyltransferase [bacterium]
MTETTHPNPLRIFDACTAFTRTEAMRTAVNLRLFTIIGEGAHRIADIAQRCGASERGIRTLCDFLVVEEFLTKNGDVYGLSPDAAAFLDERSPMFVGSIVNFLGSDVMTTNWRSLTRAVQEGGTAPESSTTQADAPVWVEFARSMAPMMVPAAHAIADIVDAQGASWKVLDIAAGHGMFGIVYAQRHPNSRVTAVDWSAVLKLAQENAGKMGVAERYETLAGSAFDIDFGSGYDLVLVPNFIHHFDGPTNLTLMKKVHASLRPGGKVAVLEFVPNNDRVSPPWPAKFSAMMLASTPSGDSYTFDEIAGVLTDAGFGDVRRHDLLPSPQTLVLASK